MPAEKKEGERNEQKINDPRDLSQYIWVQHDNGSVSRLLKPACYLDRQSEQHKQLPGQSCVAFIFEPSVQARADKNACYGLLNVIGCFRDEEEAVEHIKTFLDQNKDREDEFLVGKCGCYIPLSTAPAALCGVEIVDIEQKLHEAYGQAMDRRRKHELIETTKRAEKLQAKAEEARKSQQDKKDKEAETRDDVQSYTQLRATRASQLCAIFRLEKCMAQAKEKIGTYRQKADDIEKILKNMNRSFASEFIEIYTDELAKVGSQISDNDPECDATYLALSDEPPILIEQKVREKIRSKNMAQSHELSDDDK